jgi:hypothetical protein
MNNNLGWRLVEGVFTTSIDLRKGNEVTRVSFVNDTHDHKLFTYKQDKIWRKIFVIDNMNKRRRKVKDFQNSKLSRITRTVDEHWLKRFMNK